MHCVRHDNLALYAYIAPHGSAHLPRGCAQQLPASSSSAATSALLLGVIALAEHGRRKPLLHLLQLLLVLGQLLPGGRRASVRAPLRVSGTRRRLAPERRPDLVGAVPVLVHVHEARHAQRCQSERLARRTQRSRPVAPVLLPQAGCGASAGARAPRAHLGIDTGVDDFHLRRDGLGPLVRERAGDRRRPEVACRRARDSPRRCGALLGGIESGANMLKGGSAPTALSLLSTSHLRQPWRCVPPASCFSAMVPLARLPTDAAFVWCQWHCVVLTALRSAAAGGTLEPPTRDSQARPSVCTSAASYLQSACVPHASHTWVPGAQQAGADHRLSAPLQAQAAGSPLAGCGRGSGRPAGALVDDF